MPLNTPTLLATAAALLCTGLAHSQGTPSVQGNDALKAAAQKAIASNPDVTARFNAYRASSDAVDVSRGGFLPKLDLSASAGQDRSSIDSRTPESQSLSRSGASLTLTQLLWDGLATSKDVSRLGHERMARYFEVLDTTEQTALEASRAYYDVLRYRRLVALAEDNFVQHRSAFNQISSRVRAGVGRGVDLEQAAARLALAESNLSTETSNLHDVSARYQRVVGEAPPASLPLPKALQQGIPSSAGDAAAQAIRRSPAISASVETLRAARSTVSIRQSAFQPKVEARARAGAGRNFDGVQDQRRDSTAEVVLSWNIFNGGADQARVRQETKLLTQTADLRDKACRDTRQTVGDRLQRHPQAGRPAGLPGPQHDRHREGARRLPPAVRHRPAQPAGPAERRERALHRTALVCECRIRPGHRLPAHACVDEPAGPAVGPGPRRVHAGGARRGPQLVGRR